jgi:hypothetical protein
MTPKSETAFWVCMAWTVDTTVDRVAASVVCTDDRGAASVGCTGLVRRL